MRRFVTLVLAGLLLAGCARGGSEKPPAEPPSALEWELVKEGGAIEKPGIYYLNSATGRLEGWRWEGDQGVVMPTEDHRYLVGWGQEKGWVASRESRKAHPWDAAKYRYVIGTGDRFLFAEKESGLFVVRDAAMAQVSEFSLPSATVGAHFSPDGKMLAVAGEGQPPRLIDVASGKVTALGTVPTVKEGQVLGSFLLAGTGSALLVRHEVQHVEPTGHAWSGNIIHQYSWEGKLLSEFAVDGYPVGLSPDGKTLAWQQHLGFAAATVLTDLVTGKPGLRVASGYHASFMADGGMIMESSQGNKRLTPGGELVAAPFAGDREQWASLEGLPLPSPTQVDRFGLGPVVLDGAGKVVQEARFAPYPGGGYWFIRSLGWAPSGQEFAFTVSPPVGKGNLGGPFEGLAPKVQRAPYDDPYVLVIQDPKQECLNLRESYSTASRVIRCLPSGTKLAMGNLGEAPVKLNQPYMFQEERTWLWVRTERGEQGWVAFIEGAIHWTD